MKKKLFILFLFLFSADLKAFDGVVTPFKEMIIASKLSAPIIKISIKENQFIKENELISEFDDQKIRQEIKKEKFELEKLNIDFKKLLEGKSPEEISKLEISLSISKIKHLELENELSNMFLLLKKNGISQREFDLKKNELEISKLNIQKNEIDIKMLKDYPDTSEKLRTQINIEQKKDAIQILEEKLKFVSLKSNTSGIVKEILVKQGEHISEGGKIAVIMDISDIYAEINIPLSAISKYQQGTKIKLHIPVLNRTFESAVDSIFPNIDAVTNTVKIRTLISNPNYLIKPGMLISTVK